MKLSPTLTNQSLSLYLSLKQWAALTRTLVVRMVAAHMKYASPDSLLRKRLASQGKVPSGAEVAPALSSSVQMIRPEKHQIVKKNITWPEKIKIKLI